VPELDTLSEESYKDSTLIMQLLRDNLVRGLPSHERDVANRICRPFGPRLRPSLPPRLPQNRRNPQKHLRLPPSPRRPQSREGIGGKGGSWRGYLLVNLEGTASLTRATQLIALLSRPCCLHCSYPLSHLSARRPCLSSTSERGVHALSLGHLINSSI
jgi:hypothetical protein